jgi:hypothetical protein
LRRGCWSRSRSDSPRCSRASRRSPRSGAPSRADLTHYFARGYRAVDFRLDHENRRERLSVDEGGDERSRDSSWRPAEPPPGQQVQVDVVRRTGRPPGCSSAGSGSRARQQPFSFCNGRRLITRSPTRKRPPRPGRSAWGCDAAG